MDAGWAAVTAAGIAALVSLVAVWGGYAVARLNVKGLRQQVQDQAATEHSHWLRDRRADACLRFMEHGPPPVRSRSITVAHAEGVPAQVATGLAAAAESRTGLLVPGCPCCLT